MKIGIILETEEHEKAWSPKRVSPSRRRRKR